MKKIISSIRITRLAAIIIASFAFSLSTTIQAQVGFKSDLNGDGVENVSDLSFHINLLMGRVDDFAVRNQLCPNALHPHFIDLGLPSGTLWACCNIGAESPISFGDYYAWGETITKEHYNQNNYSHYISTNEMDESTGNEIAGTMYDVTTIKWGAGYTTPSQAQWNELMQNTNQHWVDFYETKGDLIISRNNGNMIFLPAAGVRLDQLSDELEGGYYWSSTKPDGNSMGVGVVSGRSNFSNGWQNPYKGMQVRPVKTPQPSGD